MQGTTTAPRTIVIGAGMSGILTGIKLLEAGHVNFRIYEKAAKVGGTWRENTYPNLACDIWSPSYCYSFEPNAEWTYRRGRGDEIQRYFEGVADKYRVSEHITFGSEVTEAGWDGTRWQVRFANGTTDAAEVLISAVGALHFPRDPDIPGLDTFAGAKFHTARWDHTVDLRDKRVGVIGTGSTSAQVVPGIVDKVRDLYLFQRTAQWILPWPDRKYSEASKQRRRHRWFAQLVHRSGLHVADMASAAIRGNRVLLALIDRACRKNLASVRDPELRRRLTPSYAVTCKRLVVSTDFYATMQRRNAHLVDTGIERVVPEGIVTKDGATIPLVHRTVGVPGFPNYFVVFGPYSPIGNMSIIENSEIQVGYVMQCLELIARGDVRAFDPRREVCERQKRELEKALETTVWQSGCQSWYLNATGQAVTWPWSLQRFRDDLRAPVLAEYEPAALRGTALANVRGDRAAAGSRLATATAH